MSTYQTTKDELEAMLDGGHTVADLVGMIAAICEEKADWVNSPESVGTPDKLHAGAYMAAARILTKTCASLGRNVRVQSYSI